jgi:hypothetical protein
VNKCVEKGHIVECKFWGKEKINTINGIHFDLILAENVLAHVNNPIIFLKECYNHMDDDTLLVIQTSQANMYMYMQFDTIYHEHISFFTIKSMMRAVRNVGCYLDNVYKTDIHGVSYVFEIRKGNVNKHLELLDKEISDGLYTSDLYFSYRNTIENFRERWLEILSQYKNKGYNILGFGAAAKGNVFLNYLFNSQPHTLAPEYIIDNSDAKYNKYTSGTLIQIKDVNILHEYNNKKVVIIILAWNFSEEIIKRIKEYIKNNNLNINIETVAFFPKIVISSINN